MPLIMCPECNKQVSDKADFCPHCGLPAKYFLNTGVESISTNLKNEAIDMDYTGRFVELPGNKVKCIKYPNADITFMTAHSAKGLGYDNVILINMFEGKFGFPCQLEDDPIMKLVTYEDTSMPFAEERRLFYVALTRTKNRVYIAAPKKRPSRFLVELIKDFNIPYPEDMNMETVDLFSLRCPECNFPLKYEFNKNYGLSLYICTNEAEVCDFMTNDRLHPHDILKCPKCIDG